MNLLLRFTLEPGSTKETPNNPQSLLHNKDDPKRLNADGQIKNDKVALQ